VTSSNVPLCEKSDAELPRDNYNSHFYFETLNLHNLKKSIKMLKIINCFKDIVFMVHFPSSFAYPAIEMVANFQFSFEKLNEKANENRY
jgi:hypothetical protein